MKLSLPRWVGVAAICAGIFIFVDQVVIRRSLPLLFVGFIIGQAAVWLFTPRRLSQ
jgi:hypothetical protein